MKYKARRTEEELNEMMQRLVGIMMMEHVGKENAIKVGDLERKIGIYLECDRNSFVTRKEILKLMEQSPIPFGACNKGVYILSNEQELKEYITTLTKRSRSIVDRIATVERAYKRMRKVN